MNNLTLLVMAAGMGSRYGGLKQLDSIGPNGETIIDYSIYDSIKAGFNKIVFIIRKEFEKEFKIKISNKYLDSIKIEFVFQSINDLPSPFTPNEERLKPWGTGHAILSAKSKINEPFVVINGDDFYGLNSFEKISKFYENNLKNFSMVAYKLKNTLSENGSVSRGICTTEAGSLKTVVETHGLKKVGSLIVSNDFKNSTLDQNEFVSMNFWGFTTKVFDYLEIQFIEFLKENGSKLNSEFLIPSVINKLIHDESEEIKIIETDSSWFGVTYAEDREHVIKRLNLLIEKGYYPKKLF